MVTGRYPRSLFPARGPADEVLGDRQVDEEVASLCHLSTDYYARLERELGAQPSAQMIASIAQGLHLGLDEIRGAGAHPGQLSSCLGNARSSSAREEPGDELGHGLLDPNSQVHRGSRGRRNPRPHSPGALDIATWLVPAAAIGLGALMIGAAITHLRRQEIRNVAINLILLALAVFVAFERIGPQNL